MADLITYNAVGNREDLSDIITNISPTDTPLYSGFGRGEPATATYHEWVEDALKTPGSNAQVEGAAYTVSTPTTRTRKGNYTQIFEQGYGVSRTQEAVQKAGIKSEIAYQMTKAMKEIANDVEYAIVRNLTAAAGDATTPRTLGGIQAFVTTNVLDNGGTARALTEDLLNDGVQAAWEDGGNPNMVVCSGSKKRTISGFTAGTTKTIDAQDKRLIAAIDVYESDFGILRIVPHRLMESDKIYILEKGRWKISYLRPFATRPVAETKDAIEKVIIGELTLEARAEKANAIVKDLS